MHKRRRDKTAVYRHLLGRADSSAGGVGVGNGRLHRQFVRLAHHRQGGTGDFDADFASEAWGAVEVVKRPLY